MEIMPTGCPLSPQIVKGDEMGKMGGTQKHLLNSKKYKNVVKYWKFLTIRAYELEVLEIFKK